MNHRTEIDLLKIDIDYLQAQINLNEKYQKIVNWILIIICFILALYNL